MWSPLDQKGPQQQPSLQGLSPVPSSPFVSAHLVLFLAPVGASWRIISLTRTDLKHPSSGSRAHLLQKIPVLEHCIVLLTHHNSPKIIR